MNNILEYKGYMTKVEYDSESNILYGKIEGINDLVNFECESIKDVEKEFHSAVDDYLEFCKENNKEPDKDYRGLFNVRIKPYLHKKLAIEAFKTNNTLNSLIESIIIEHYDKNIGLVCDNSVTKEYTKRLRKR